MAGEILGTKGYAKIAEEFVKSSRALNFDIANSDFLDFVPKNPCRVLDAGAGAGQNAAALAERGTGLQPLNLYPNF